MCAVSRVEFCMGRRVLLACGIIAWFFDLLPGGGDWFLRVVFMVATYADAPKPFSGEILLRLATLARLLTNAFCYSLTAF